MHTAHGFNAIDERYGTPPFGSPLHAAVIGVDSLATSVQFYERFLGLDVVGKDRLRGTAFETHWCLPSGASAEIAVLADRDCPVGRLVLMDFDASHKSLVRNIHGQRFYGLVNLNFYTEDVFAHTKLLASAGCRPWSEPVMHHMASGVGEPIEVMLDGPDSLILNMIQLHAKDSTARLLRTLAYIMDSGGFNRCGSTPVATSQHCVRDHARAMDFNTRVLEMTVRNDVILAGDDMESFMDYPPGARSRDTYLQGNHVYGKIAINHPLNFACVDLIHRSVAPNVGYLAQSFIVPSLQDALGAAASIGAELYSEAVEFIYPSLGSVTTAILRNPGSGALHELIERR